MIGREVRITSLSFSDMGIDRIAPIVDAEGMKGTDLIVLPETWTGQAGHVPELLDGATVTTMAGLAQKHNAYIVCPIDRIDGAKRVNTAVLIGRDGTVAGLYDKIYPYWSEFDVTPKVTPGCNACVLETDFGRLGLAICFDVNFPEVWQSLADQGAELVAWPSAYSAGTSLLAHALNHHYYIVTSTGTGDCLVYDITGEELLYEKSPEINVSRITLDLDRGIYHENYNMEKRDRLLKDHGDDIYLEKSLPREQWFVLKSRRENVRVRSLAKEYGLEELRDYLHRSRREINLMRSTSKT